MSALLKFPTPNAVNRQVKIAPGRKPIAPGRKSNKEIRGREHLTEAEVDKLIKAAKVGRHGHRDATMILVAYRHGLRAAELCDLQWDQITMDRNANLHVHRIKGSASGNHPIKGDELRALRELRRLYPDSDYVFCSERGGPFTTDAYNKQIKRIGAAAKMPFPIHSHMLRHACGYKLAADGVDTRSLQAYLGHKNIQHTVRYTEQSPTRFKNFWRKK
jgi:integrase